MLLAAQAWRLREAARQALAGGEGGLAAAVATRAQRLRYTPRGEALRLLGEWLHRNGEPPCSQAS
jgi:hypothetical protein